MMNSVKYLTRVLRRLTKRTSKNDLKYANKNQFAIDGLIPNHAFLDMRIDKDYLKGMLKDCYRILQEYLDGNRNSLEKLLRDRTYILVTGAPRTGGAYTTKQLRRIFCQYKANDLVVLNESIPVFYHLIHSADPLCRNQALFELIQWLYWIDQNYREHSTIVKKCTGFSYAMNLVGDFFGDTKIIFIVTTRHPAPIWNSSKEHMIRYKLSRPVIPMDNSSYLFKDREPPQWWLEESEKLRALYMWQDLYNRLAETLPENRKNSTCIVRYGDQTNILVDAVSRVDPSMVGKMKELTERDPFKPTERTYSGFWYTDIVGAVIESNKAHWERRKLHLPVDHLRIE